MKINLVKNGIFPITKDKNGQPLNEKLDTGFKEKGTIQGEGSLIGTPCLFLRTSSCNIRCVWNSDKGGSPCDTVYSSHLPESNKTEIQDIIDTLKANLDGSKIKHIVISGGEPFLQIAPLLELVKRIKEELDLHITIETNATIFSETFGPYVDLYSMSPKLSNSIPTKEKFVGPEMEGLTYSEIWEKKHKNLHINIPIIQNMIDTANKNGKRFQIKFVVSKEEDLIEINDIVSKLSGLKTTDVLLMPEGYFAEDIIAKSIWLAEKCVENGYTFTTRLHTLLFGTKRGV